MVIAKTASRNVAFKADMMSQAVLVLEAQASFVTPEARGQESGGLSRWKWKTMTLRLSVTLIYNLYVFNYEVAQC